VLHAFHLPEIYSEQPSAIMHRKVPPGLQYIANNARFLFLPIILTFLAIIFLRYVCDVKVPLWLGSLFILCSLPTTAMASLCATRFYQEYRAKSYGAALPVPVKYKLPGGLDILLQVLRELETIYPGMRFVLLRCRIQIVSCCQQVATTEGCWNSTEIHIYSISCLRLRYVHCPLVLALQ